MRCLKAARLTIATTREVDPGEPRFGTAVSDRGALTVITVSDTGCGMTKEIQSHIFEPFFTTKAFGKGTGLGLATVYGIVQQSGGAIELETAPEQGARFRIIFPGLAGAVPASSAAEAPRTAPAVGTETVLLVEDNESVRALAFQALTRRGYRVFEAANGEEGIRIATELGGAIDLVITDVVMPVMGGRELSTRLRRDVAGHEDPVHVRVYGRRDPEGRGDGAGIVFHPEAIYPGLPAAGRARHARPGRSAALTWACS